MYAAQNAIDEDNSTTWNAGSFAVEWIEVDLGSSLQIDQVTGLTEQTPAGNTRHDVFLDDLFSFSWGGPTTSGQLFTHDFITPIIAQTVRIETRSSPGWVAWR